MSARRICPDCREVELEPDTLGDLCAGCALDRDLYLAATQDQARVLEENVRDRWARPGSVVVLTDGDTVVVATGGHIDRDDVCAECGKGLIFRIHALDGSVASRFCGNLQGDCPAVFVEIRE